MGILRTGIRTGLILLLAGLVIAATYGFTPIYNTDLTPAKEVPPSAGNKDGAMPGSEDALRRVIADIQENRPVSVRMYSVLAASTRQSFSRDRRILGSLGRLQSINYRGADFEGDVYRTIFEKGSLVWKISLGRGGAIETLRFMAPQGPTAQDWIDWYALVQTGKGPSRLIIELGKLLALVGIGRFAGLRL
jgi:hypothetical protein